MDQQSSRTPWEETVSNLFSHLRFDNRSTRTKGRENDRYAPLRDIWETVMKNCSNAFIPHGSVTIDEQPFACKSRCSFIQYMSRKPGKFGIKYWLICDSETSCVLNAIPYVGKDDSRHANLGLANHVILSLSNPYFGSGINVTTDNFFTSLHAAEFLLKEKITMVGTVRENRREIPTALRAWAKNVSQHSSEFFFSENAMMVGYKAKPNETVFLLSTAHSKPVVEAVDSKKRPQIVLYYNSKKSGVDTADQMLRSYSTKCTSRRWPLGCVFQFVGHRGP